MKKLLTLSLASVLVLGACNFNNDTNKSNDDSDSSKDKKTSQDKSNKNDNNQDKNPKEQSGTNNQDDTNNQSKISPKQAKEIILEENNNGALDNFKYNKQKSTDNKIIFDFMGPGAVDRLPMQAVVDAYSGEVLDKYVNETKEQKIARAKNHLQAPKIINKLQDPLIEKYQPQAYNKLKKYEQEHPNAFSSDDGHANQKLVNKILGYDSGNNTGENKNDNTNDKNESNSGASDVQSNQSENENNSEEQLTNDENNQQSSDQQEGGKQKDANNKSQNEEDSNNENQTKNKEQTQPVNKARQQALDEGIDFDNPSEEEIDRMRELSEQSPYGMQEPTQHSPRE